MSAKRKSCEAKAIANCIQGECKCVQKIHDTYGFGCAYPARHSVVIRELGAKPSFKKLILRVCNSHFEMMQHDDLQLLSDTKCCFGTDTELRMNFRRNRL
jgi:hypothetical protein